VEHVGDSKCVYVNSETKLLHQKIKLLRLTKSFHADIVSVEWARRVISIIAACFLLVQCLSCACLSTSRRCRQL